MKRRNVVNTFFVSIHPSAANSPLNPLRFYNSKPSSSRHNKRQGFSRRCFHFCSPRHRLERLRAPPTRTPRNWMLEFCYAFMAKCTQKLRKHVHEFFKPPPRLAKSAMENKWKLDFEKTTQTIKKFKSRMNLIANWGLFAISLVTLTLPGAHILHNNLKFVS